MDNPTTNATTQQNYNIWAILGFVFAFITPILGLIFSIIALRQLRKQTMKGKGLATAGIIISVILMIILIVAVTVPFVLNTVREKNESLSTTSDISQIQSALALYFNDNKSYPPRPVYVLGVKDAVKLCDKGFVSNDTSCSKVYLNQVPIGPSGDPSYHYSSNEDHSTYCVDFMMSDGWHSARPNGIVSGGCPFSLE